MWRLAPLVLLLVLPLGAAWTWPVNGPVLQGFSFDPAHPYAAGQHRGIAIGATAAGVPVLAPASGVVSFAGTVPSSGKSLTIETPDGLAVTLTHLGTIDVARGAPVAEGAAVGTVGPTGTPEVEGPYVHLGIRTAANAQGYLDPLSFLPPVVVEPPPAPPVAPPAPAPVPVPVAPPAVAPPAAAPPAVAPPAAAPPAVEPPAAAPAPPVVPATEVMPAAPAAAPPAVAPPAAAPAPPVVPATEVMPAAPPAVSAPPVADAPPAAEPAPAPAPPAAPEEPAAPPAPAEPPLPVEDPVPAPAPLGRTVAPEIVAPAEAPAAPLVLEHGFTAIAARVAAAAGAHAPVAPAAAPTREPAPPLEATRRVRSAPQLRTARPLPGLPASHATRPRQPGSPTVLLVGIAGLAAAAACGAAVLRRRSPKTLPSPPRLRVVPPAEPEHGRERLAA